MKLIRQKGFTLVELLVVVAIIGILTSIVTLSLNIARGKGANAAVKANLKGLGGQAEVFYDNSGGTYVGFCGDPNVDLALKQASVSGTGVDTNSECQSSGSEWAAQTPFKIADGEGNTFWCVDNSGAARGETVALGANTQCP
jgi:prepilin-type N-terminal cleavage/methylation domain-containing protein